MELPRVVSYLNLITSSSKSLLSLLFYLLNFDFLVDLGLIHMVKKYLRLSLNTSLRRPCKLIIWINCVFYILSNNIHSFSGSTSTHCWLIGRRRFRTLGKLGSLIICCISRFSWILCCICRLSLISRCISWWLLFQLRWLIINESSLQFKVFATEKAVYFVLAADCVKRVVISFSQFQFLIFSIISS